MPFTPTFTPVTERATLAGMGYGVPVDIGLDSANAYVAGGFSLDGCGIQTVIGVAQIGNDTAGEGYVAQWNTTTNLLQIFVSGASASPLQEFVGTFGASISIRGWVLGW